MSITFMLGATAVVLTISILIAVTAIIVKQEKS